MRLTPGLDLALKAMAKATGRKPPDLVRDAIERLVNEGLEKASPPREEPVQPASSPQRHGCAVCGERAGQLHKKSCYLGGSVSAR